MSSKLRLAITTGGGDAPGLNAVIRAAVLAAEGRGWEMVGIQEGYNGLFEEDGVVPLDRESVRGITHLGGTVLGTTNRGNPFSFPVAGDDGEVTLVDRSDEVVSALEELGVDGLIAVGGDGSLAIAHGLSVKGVKVIGVPKTIDNDLGATSVTFGFHTAVQTATDAIDKLHSTAEAHRRIMVVELMGRNAGWIALFAGVAATADVILIPEIPYDLAEVAKKIESRWARRREFAIVVVAEGAAPAGGDVTYLDREEMGTARRLGGIGERIAGELEALTGKEARSLVLGHLQRGGQPTAYDRVLALRFGAGAIELAEAGLFGCMVALDPPEVKAVPLEEAIDKLKTVPVEGDMVRTARAMGVSFGG